MEREIGQDAFYGPGEAFIIRIEKRKKLTIEMNNGPGSANTSIIYR